jgi:hypothetical protein
MMARGKAAGLRGLTPSLLALAVACGLAGAAGAQAVGDVTYAINQSIGSGSVVGQIVTDGKTGVLAQSDIVSWSLTLNGAGGVSSNITSVGGESVFKLVGSDLSATSTNLYFNYSGSDTGWLAFQVANPGLYSGHQYYCDNTNWFGCSKGASVVPTVYNDPSAIYDTSWTGNQVIASVAGPSDSALFQSIVGLIDSRSAQMLISQLESQVLLGLNEQVSCNNCGGGGVTFGSFDLSAHGRYALAPEWTVLGGVHYGRYDQKGADVTLNAGFAAAVQYDPAGMGASRPYARVGMSASYQQMTYRRSYANGQATDTGVGSTQGYDLSAEVEAGWVDRFTRRDEAAAFVSYSRMWQIVDGYTEQSGVSNPASAAVPGGTDTMDVAALGAQYTHLFGRRIEADLNGSVDWAFAAHSGLAADIGDAEIAANRPAFVYYQAGVRLGVRVLRRLTADFYVNGVLARSAIGSSAHGGVGVRWAF